MINRSEKITKKEIFYEQQGEGSILEETMFDSNDLAEKVRMFSIITINKGCSIGKHYHNEETEYYFALKGEGVYSNNGSVSAFKKGDVVVCGGKKYHSIRNENDEPLIFIVVIILH